MAAMMSVLARLTALEAEVATLREVQPLESFTASLKAASPEEVKAWMDLCNEVAGEYMAKHVKPKVVKEKKATTNETGPAEWNVFLNAVWRSMAAANGIVCEDADEFKKAVKAAGKDSGFTYQDAMKEASRQKAALEGKEPKVKVAKEKVKAKTDLAELKAKVAAAAAKVAPAAAAAPPSPKAPKAAAAAAAPKVVKAVPAAAAASPAKVPFTAVTRVETELDRQLAAAAEMGWVVVEHEGETFFHDPSDDTAFSYPDGDDQIGSYTAATAFADAEFIRSE
jgi:hypothetical protein